MAMTPAVIPPTEALDRRISVAQVEARRGAILELMKKAMREDVDYGTLPGAPKPSLRKPGAEKVCSMFQLAPRVHVEDLSCEDAFAYQCRVELYASSGVFCGEGIGICSSNESKYKWRAATGPGEFQNTPEDRRRTAYKRDARGAEYQLQQVRTEPADQQNTVLKMAKKRGLIDAVLTVTAASDIFTQDIDEDEAPEEKNHELPVQAHPPRPASPAPASVSPAQRPAAAKPHPRPKGQPVTDAQVRRFYAIASGAGKTAEETKQYLFRTIRSEHAHDLTRDTYDQACAWAMTKLARPDTAEGSDPGPEEPDEPEEDDEDVPF